MKRCSQCDFIYEDDQNLCDMDGHELVYEPTLQSLQINTIPATKPPTRSVRSRARRLALVAAVAVVLGTVLSVGYSGFTSEYAPENLQGPSTNAIRAPQSTPSSIPATPTVTPTPSPSHSPRSEKINARVASAARLARSTTRFRSPAPRREVARAQPTKANRKKESGIGGFLKKTGKILKRPFKF